MGVSVQDTTCCSPKPSASVPQMHAPKKCLLSELMFVFFPRFISTSQDRKGMDASLRKAVDLKNNAEFGNKIKTLINLDFTRPDL